MLDDDMSFSARFRTVDLESGLLQRPAHLSIITFRIFVGLQVLSYAPTWCILEVRGFTPYIWGISTGSEVAGGSVACTPFRGERNVSTYFQPLNYFDMF
jgi:hypothetical protein